MTIGWSLWKAQRTLTPHRRAATTATLLGLAIICGLGGSGCGEDVSAKAAGQCAGGCDGGANGDGSISSLYGDRRSGSFVWEDGGDAVFDSATGLMWQRKVSSTKRKWQDAIDYCDSLVVGAYDDWKLPHKDELESLVLSLTTTPSIDTLAFPQTPAKPFWTRTLYAPNAAHEAFGVDFENGGTGHALKSEPHFVRCVRTPSISD
ncbi:MAG: DUF1566 domain-containing protein [Myxococcales bacterium]|nr:DUF1566 domain-containing protein [Myxococcales bacterium]